MIPSAELQYSLPLSYSFFSREENHELRTDSVTVVAIVLGVVALSQIKKSPEKYTGKPFATAGVIIGAIIVAFYLLLLLWALLRGGLG